MVLIGLPTLYHFDYHYAMFFLGNLLFKSNTKGNFKDRFPISKWMKFKSSDNITTFLDERT